MSIRKLFSSMILFRLAFLAVAQASVSEIGPNLWKLTSDSFEEQFKKYPNGFFVKFMVPWSKQCQHWAQYFKEASEQVNAVARVRSLGMKIPFFEVDMTESENSSLANRFMITGYPTFLFLQKHDVHDIGDDKDNIHSEEFEGDLAVESVLRFVESVVGPPLMDEPPTPDEKLSLTLVSRERREGFEILAKKNRKRAHWHWAKDREDAEGVRVELRHRHEDAVVLPLGDKNQQEERKIKAFMMQNANPIYGFIDRESFPTYADKPVVWVLPAHGEADFDEKQEKFRPLVLQANKLLQQDGKKAEWFFAACNTIDFGGPLQSMFGATDFPTIIAQRHCGSQAFWRFADDTAVEEAVKDMSSVNKTAGSVAEWLQKITAGSIEREYRSEPIPDYEVEEGEPEIVVGKTIDAKIFNDVNRDIFLNVYAPWCGHCKNFSPEFRKIARKVHLSGLKDKILVASLDGTVNESTNSNLQWSGFPTILFFQRDKKEQSFEYRGKRDAEMIWKWIKDLSSFSTEMDAEFGDVKLDL